MSMTAAVVNRTIKQISRLLCQVDDSQLHLVPNNGPLILVTNHINFIEVPLMYTHLLPRPVTGFIKSETWDNPAMALLFNFWQGIPIRRGEADIQAIRLGIQALQQGRILTVAPEGTRSGSGRLGPGHPGVVLVALQSQAPVLPVVYFGGEKLRNNLTHLRRTNFSIVVGSPFKIEPGPGRTTREVRKKIAGEIMYQMAALLPPAYRGLYSDLSQASEDYLRFEPPATSNLMRARREFSGSARDV